MSQGQGLRGWELLLPVSRGGGEPLPLPLQVAGYFACVVVFVGMQALHLFEPLDLRVYDLQLQAVRAAHGTALANDVQVIGLDEGSFKAFPEPFALWHRPFARLLKALEAAQPAVVGLDVVLPEHSYEFLAPGLDRALVAALMSAHRQYPLVIAQTLGDDGGARALFAPYIAAVGHDGVGSSIVCNDPDGITRQYDGSLCDGTPVPTLSSQMAARLGRTPAQVPGGWRGRIDFRIGAPFRYTSMQDVIDAAERGDSAFLQRFHGRPVLIGATLPFDDRLLLPVALADWEHGNRRVPGVLLHAQILRSMLNYGFLQPLGQAWVAALNVLLCGAWFLAGPTRPLVYWSSFGVLAVLGTYAVWLGSYLPAAAVLLSMQGAYLARAIANWLWNYRAQRAGERQLAQRLSPEQLSALLRRQEQAPAADACVLACRIAPALHDLHAPGSNAAGKAALINRLQRAAEDAVHRHHGRIDWRGDGLLVAVFAGTALPLAARRGFETANDLLHTAAQLRTTLTAQLPDLRIAVHAGLECGAVALAHIGTPQAHALRPWGAAVNAAEALALAAQEDRLDLLVGNGAARHLPPVLLPRLSAHPAAAGAWQIEALAQ